MKFRCSKMRMERGHIAGAIVIGCVVTAILVSCVTSFPPVPSRYEDCLVIGALSINFPDGYNDDSVRFAANSSLKEGVRLYFRNVTQDKDFSLELGGSGYFCFLSNGSDEYLLKSTGYSRRRGETILFITGEINIRIASKPASVIYLGSNSFRFSNPQRGRKVQTLRTDWTRVGLRNYLKNNCRGNGCRWITSRVVENRFEPKDEYVGEVNQGRSLRPQEGALHIDPHYRGPPFPEQWPLP